MFGLSEMAILLLIAIVVIGAKKLPDLARSAGKSARILRSEARAVKDGTADTEPRATYQVKQTPPGQGPERTS
ncbi:twin-arginine translocase TatA/TatE family subunit [Streptomyces sp. NPDC003943]